MSEPEKNNSNSSKLNDLNGTEWIKRTISWFILQPKPRTESVIHHPGKYPEELVERFVSFFTHKGQWVLDPFVGVGSTLIGCRNLERNCVGIDLNPEFVNISKNRLKQKTLFETSKQIAVCGDSLKIDEVMKNNFNDKIPKFNMIMTSPPYWNMLSKQRGGSDSQHKERKEKGLELVYSTDEKDFGNIESYSQYLEFLITVFKKLKPFLENNAFLVVVLQNIREESGKFVPIAWDFGYKMEEFYEMRPEEIWCQTDKTAGIWGFPKTYVSNVHHHYCMIFQNTKI